MEKYIFHCFGDECFPKWHFEKCVNHAVPAFISKDLLAMQSSVIVTAVCSFFKTSDHTAYTAKAVGPVISGKSMSQNPGALEANCAAILLLLGLLAKIPTFFTQYFVKCPLTDMYPNFTNKVQNGQSYDN